MTTASRSLVDDPALPRSGELVDGRYLILGVLGQGGFAVVYRATDTRRDAEVAVKVLDPIMSRRDDFAERFKREVQVVSRLQHHNTIKVFDAGETSRGCLFLVMELLDGHSLEEVLAAEKQLDPERVRHIAVQILRSLNEAHGIAVIHRDLKPGNIYLAQVAGETDYVKVLDFGIAKTLDESADATLTATGQVMCSPHYVAPERVSAHHTVPASDLYSLGVMLIELLEGKPPYDAETPMMLAVRHMRLDEPVPIDPAVRSSPLGAVLARATAKSLEDRYAGASEMLAALEALPRLSVAPINIRTREISTAPSPSVGDVTRTRPEGRSISEHLPVPRHDAPPPAARSNPRTLVAAVVVTSLLLVVAAVLIARAARAPDTAVGDVEALPAPLASPVAPPVAAPITAPVAPASSNANPGSDAPQRAAADPIEPDAVPTPAPDGQPDVPAAAAGAGAGPAPDGAAEPSTATEPERADRSSRTGGPPPPPPVVDPSPAPIRTPVPEPTPDRAPAPATEIVGERGANEIVGERGARPVDAGGYVRGADAGSTRGYFGH